MKVKQLLPMVESIIKIVSEESKVKELDLDYELQENEYMFDCGKTAIIAEPPAYIMYWFIISKDVALSMKDGKLYDFTKIMALDAANCLNGGSYQINGCYTMTLSEDVINSILNGGSPFDFILKGGN